jgi:hypothetical protein
LRASPATEPGVRKRPDEFFSLGGRKKVCGREFSKAVAKLWTTAGACRNSAGGLRERPLETGAPRTLTLSL